MSALLDRAAEQIALSVGIEDDDYARLIARATLLAALTMSPGEMLALSLNTATELRDVQDVLAGLKGLSQ